MPADIPVGLGPLHPLPSPLPNRVRPRGARSLACHAGSPAPGWCLSPVSYL